MCCSSKFEACICFEGKGQRREEKLGTTRRKNMLHAYVYIQ